MRIKLLLVLCSSLFCLAHAHTADELGPDADRHFHENQIPPPNRQPSREDIQNLLIEVFTLADKDSDKTLDAEELRDWLKKVHNSLVEENVNQQWSYYNPQVQEVHSWDTYDPENRETLTWEQYVNFTYPEDVIQASKQSEKPDLKSDDPNFKSYFVMLKRAEKRWKAADKSGDNVLIKEEFKNFIHPEESDESKYILVVEAMEDMDLDSNGEITLEEYIKHMNEVSSDEDKQDPGFNQNHQSQFATYLDKNKDGVLNKEEINEWLSPDYDRHEAEAQRMIHDSDHDHDHKLSQDEMVNNDEYFMSLIPGEFWRRFPDFDDSTTHTSHDEF